MYHALLMLTLILRLLGYAIMIEVILTWIMPGGKLQNFFRRVTEPLVGLFRPLAYKLFKGRMRLDFSPFFAMIALSVVTVVLERIMMAL